MLHGLLLILPSGLRPVSRSAAWLLLLTTAASACKPVVVTSPLATAVCEGSAAVYHCSATGTNLSYTWQGDAGTGFKNLTEGATYQGVLLPTLTVSSTTLAFDNNIYRCIVSNTCGSVTSETAVLRVSTPPAATCTPTTLNTGNWGTGIDRVQFAGIDNSHTGGDNDGLSDFTCTNTAIVDPGSNYTITVTLNDGSPENCRVYIDYDNSGSFESGEIVYNAAYLPGGIHQASIAIPPFPPLADTLVRMRVISDYNAIQGGCQDVGYGEFEDYGLFLTAAPCVTPAITSQPPARPAGCPGSPLVLACSAVGPFVAYAWEADEGNGFGPMTNNALYGGSDTASLTLSNVSTAMRYFRFRCIVSSPCGGVTSTISQLLAPGAPAAACTPETANTGNFGTGIDRVQFADIDHSHADLANDGTSDFSCSQYAMVEAGASYGLTVTLRGTNPEYCRTYLDSNNDGSFTPDEIVYNSASRIAVHAATVQIPTNSLAGTILRLRVISDYNTIVDGCTTLSYGEIEDYGIYVTPPPIGDILGAASITSTALTFYTKGLGAGLTVEVTTNLLHGNAWEPAGETSTLELDGTNASRVIMPDNRPGLIFRLRQEP